VSAHLPAVTPGYAANGVVGFYEQHGATYRNPHEDQIRAALRRAAGLWNLDLGHVLDLACGSGEATLELRALGATAVTAIDPYTQLAFAERTGSTAAPLTFADVASGALEGDRFSLVVCSYAMHLCEPSRLAGLCLALAQVAPAMLILSPHKRPVIKSGWGWSAAEQIIDQRVHARLYTRAWTTNLRRIDA
jgi:SAM-dependent methyltransferase